MWHVSSRSGVATLLTAIHLLLTYLLCLSVCPSVTSRRYIETGEQQIELILAHGLPSTCLTPRRKEIRAPPKIRVLPSGTLSETLDVIIKFRRGRTC